MQHRIASRMKLSAGAVNASERELRPFHSRLSAAESSSSSSWLLCSQHYVQRSRCSLLPFLHSFTLTHERCAPGVQQHRTDDSRFVCSAIAPTRSSHTIARDAGERRNVQMGRKYKQNRVYNIVSMSKRYSVSGTQHTQCWASEVEEHKRARV